MKKIKNSYQKLKKKTVEWSSKRFFLSFVVLGLVLVFGGAFLVFSTEEEPKKEALEEIEEEKEPYPRKIDGIKKEVPLVAGAYSVYYKNGEENVLYEDNADTSLPIASISKIMTALVVFEEYDLQETVQVSEYEIVSRTEFRDFRAWGGTKVEEMVHQMLVESNNSGAFALALISNRFLEKEGNPIDNFIAEMNAKAEKIGMKDTEFINPSGLDGRGNYNLSTAKDIATLSKYLIESQEDILSISAMPSYRLYSPDKSIFYKAINTNDFLHSSNERGWEETIVGGKTGWTYAAYGCLLLVLEAPTEDGGYLINVVLGAEDRFQEMERLVDYIYYTYEF